jgi:streptomycin 6-kinase
VHGDAAAANVLQVLAPREGAETGFVLVDPDGFVGDPAYDLGVALRDWCPQLLASGDPLTLARHYRRLRPAVASRSRRSGSGASSSE